MAAIPEKPSTDNQAKWRIRNRDLEFGTQIGSGTFGSVYEGTWCGKSVALKRIFIKVGKHGGSDFEDLVKAKKWREFDVWFRLRCPYIVELYGAAVKNREQYRDWELTFVMEKCEVSLFQLLTKFPNLSVGHRIKFAYETAAGMRYIHDNNILHRDLKCMNILILDDVAKICDFGTSRFHDQNGIDMTLAPVGSPSHMAPEIWHKKAASRESDVWSYGMCVYNIFAGIPPFDGKDMVGLHQYLIIRNRRPQWPRGVSVPKWVKQLVGRCWETKPHDRISFEGIIELFHDNAPELIAPSTPVVDDGLEHKTVEPSEHMVERFVASTILSAVGDIFGFFNGKFEAQDDGIQIHKEVEERGGVLGLNPKTLNLRLSSDIILSMAISRALISDVAGEDFILTQNGLTPVMEQIAIEFIRSMQDMRGRYAGGMTQMAMKQLGYKHGLETAAEEQRKEGDAWHRNPYSPKGGGCGGTTRACPIGLRFPGEKNRRKLIAVAIESGRMTHNNTTGFLGSLVAALFTSFAIEGIHPYQWGKLLIQEIRPLAFQYLENARRDMPQINKDFKTFFVVWKKYLKERRIEKGKSPVKFPKKYNVKQRDEFYKSYSFAGKGGASGHDSVIISYDALLGAIHVADKDKDLERASIQEKTLFMWEEILRRGVFHGGDSDSTGTIVGAWFGAYFGLDGIPLELYEGMEKYKELNDLGIELSVAAGYSA